MIRNARIRSAAIQNWHLVAFFVGFVLVAIGFVVVKVSTTPARIVALPDGVRRFEEFYAHDADASQLIDNRDGGFSLLVQLKTGEIVIPLFRRTRILNNGFGPSSEAEAWQPPIWGKTLRLPVHRDIATYLLLAYRSYGDTKSWRSLEVTLPEFQDRVLKSPAHQFVWPPWHELTPVDDRNDCQLIMRALETAGRVLSDPRN